MELRTQNATKNKTVKRQVDFNNKLLTKPLDALLSEDSVDRTISEIEQLIKEKAEAKTAKPKNIHKDHRMRLKSQYLQNGYESLTDIQKLELLLFYAIPQKDTNPLAHKLLDEIGSLKDVLSADVSRLIKVKGIKENSAILINLIGKLFTAISKPDGYTHIGGIKKAKEFCKKLYVGVEVEQFYVICLTKANRIMKYKLIKTGTADEVSIQIRSITEFALECNCNRIIVSHNHPGSIGAMSDEDCKFTYSLLCSCLLNSIEVIDHIIVGMDRTISMHSQRMLDMLKEKAYDRLQLTKEKRTFLSSLSENYLRDDDE